MKSCIKMVKIFGRETPCFTVMFHKISIDFAEYLAKLILNDKRFNAHHSEGLGDKERNLFADHVGWRRKKKCLDYLMEEKILQ